MTVPTARGAMPLLGHLPELVREPLEFFRRLREYGPLIQVRLGTRPAYVVTSPDLARRVHVTDQNLFDKGGPLYEKVRAYLGNGLATCSADDHAHQRRLVQPAFHPTRLRAYSTVAHAAIADVTAQWRPGRIVRLDDEMHRFTALVTSRTLISAERAGHTAEEVSRALPDITKGLYWRMLIPGRLFARLPLPLNRRYTRRTAQVRALVDEVIDEYSTGDDRADLLSAVIRAYGSDHASRQAIHDQVVTILTGGVETTAATIVWAARMLDRHPPVAEGMRAELREVLDGRLPHHDDAPALPYTRRVLTETLRLHPPGWLVTRKATADVEWDGLCIPAGSDVLLSPHALHRDPAVFPDPDAFVPDRWAPGLVTSLQRESFFAFGGGRRKCVGDALAMNEATTALAALHGGRWTLHHLSDTSDDRGTLRISLAPPATPVRLE